ncbi:HD domain-containing protein [Patescibacteria group bacterium]|nr:HD domain-containing protein [Patescibacteria group bacterium]
MSVEEQKVGKFIKKVLKDPAFVFVSEILETPEAEIFFVGGGVRDILLEREMKDYDFVIRGIPQKKLEEKLEKFGTLKFVGKKFGVYKFVPNNSKLIIDIALPRTEFATGPAYRDFEIKSDETLPIETDLKRRDFTINALAFDLATGHIIDVSGGFADLKKKKIRAIGNPLDRFQEDYTRMLRAIRQAVELGFEIEPKTFAAIKKEARKIVGHKKAVVPYEMISQEFLKALDNNPLETFVLYDKASLIEVLFPELEASRKIRQSKKDHPEVMLWRHLKIVLSKLERQDSLRLKLAALFHDVGKSDTRQVRYVKGQKKTTFYEHENEGSLIFEKIATRMKFSSKLSHDVSFLIKNHLFLWHGSFRDMKLSTLYRIFLEDYDLGQDLLKLHIIDVPKQGAAKSKDMCYLKSAQAYLEKIKKQAMNKKEKVDLPLGGQDIIKHLRIKEGPEVGRLLAKAKEYYLEKRMAGKKVSKEDLLNHLAQEL